ncbi:hypothetical protein HYN69_18230 (plasmid) [Gemmobacter aquarius]|uniref:Uncharacterized protein n=1 Tax=Paragemmobacter aquarius TaxID=2169400 RepID=A0A2S0URW6_9RHOB|nr:hypothetical protein [Gemmobacter aquarius]AWB50547.1 hypothetical protein HYN69_18230 [Gemmobacter aquarius]
MKNTTLSLVVVATACAISGQAFAGDCTMASIKGHYNYWAQGTDAAGKASAEVGKEIYDGAGNFTSVIAVAGTAALASDSGTYTVNADCTGTATYASGGTYNLLIAPLGDSFVFASSTEGVVQAGENTRVDAD